MREERIYDEFETYIIPPSWKERTWSVEEYKKWAEDLTKDKESIEKWWERWANELFWFKKWEKVLDDSNPPFYRWFVGAETNLAYLCTDWQIELGRKNKIAIIWEGEPWDKELNLPREVKKLTFYDLYKESNRIAYALKEKFGVRKGEVLTFYLPMIPELPLYMLAVQRLGAGHSVVYSGFSAEALAARILHAEARIVVTADGLFRRGKTISLKPIVDEALKICEERGHEVEKVVVVKRIGEQVRMEKRDVWHHEFIKDVPHDAFVECARCKGDDLSFVLYTSGTTGAPKGAQHSVAGYAVGLYATMKMIFDIRDDDIFWCTADIGWITGHSYIVYGPLICGATTIMYEGAPDYPSPDRWWDMIDRYGVTIFYTAPTAIRMLMRHPDEYVKKHSFKTIRIAHSVGEPINPEAWRWYYKNVGHEDAVTSSTWWMTETGQMLTGHFPGLGKIFPLKPGTNGFPVPGVKMEVVDEEGKPCKPGVRGYLVITTPWPSMFMTLYKDPKRYLEVYWNKFSKNGIWIYYTGDYAVIDQDGMIWVLGRADDIIKVAGHRIGTAEVESAMVSHPAVAEAACIGKSDPIKGEIPVIFTVLKQGFDATDELAKELKTHLRKTIGPIVASDAIVAFVTTLPKTRSGKIMRRTLKAVLEGKPLGDLTTLEDVASIEEVKRAYELIRSSLEGGS